MASCTGVRGAGKLSLSFRYLVLARVNHCIDELQSLYECSMQDASSESILEHAASTPLPMPQGDEGEELRERKNEGEMASVFRQLQAALARVGEEPATLSDDLLHISDSINYALRFKGADEITEPTRNNRLYEQVIPSPSPSPSDKGILQNTDMECSATGAKVRQEIEPKALNFWRASDYQSLAAFCKEIMRVFESHFAGFRQRLSPTNSTCTLLSSRNPSNSGISLDSVSLTELRLEIRAMERLRNMTKEGIKAHSRHLATRGRLRYDMYAAGGDITMVMRSGGLGSPLSNVTAVHDQEDEMDYWGAPRSCSPRRKLWGSLGTPVITTPLYDNSSNDVNDVNDSILSKDWAALEPCLW